MATFLVIGSCFSVAAPIAHGAPCLIVTLTGTGPGPGVFKGLAGPGTLVRYGEDSNNCSATQLPFDVGRGTTMRLSELGLLPAQLDAIFFTHMHTDHTEGFPDLVTHRWFFNGSGPKLDVVCSADSKSPAGFTLSCKNFIAHIADAFLFSGEVAQRHSEAAGTRTQAGPADLIHTMTFDPKDRRQGPWPVPGGSLTKEDYRKAVDESGFKGTTVVGSDLASIRLPEK